MAPTASDILKHLATIEESYTNKMKRLELEKDCLLLAHECYCQYLATGQLKIKFCPEGVVKTTYGRGFPIGKIAYGFDKPVVFPMNENTTYYYQNYQAKGGVGAKTLPTPPCPKDIFEIAKAVTLQYAKDGEDDRAVVENFKQNLSMYGLQLESAKIATTCTSGYICIIIGLAHIS
jgi:hypothetical protein